jgi:hypothetical protein
LRGVAIVGRMLLWGLWAFVGLHAPASSSSSQLVFGLAVVAAALLIVAAAGLRVLPLPTAFWSRSIGRRVRVSRLSRQLDPDAAGRPRPRAPTPAPAALSR